MTHFTYNNKSTEDFGVMVVSFDDLDILESGLQREISKGDTTDYRYTANHFGTKYSGVIEFTKALIKNDYSTFTKEEISDINSWLTSPKCPKYLEFTGCNDKSYLYCGLFTNIQYKVNSSGIIGIIFTFTNNSPFLYLLESQSYTVTSGEQISFECNSDLSEDYCYPTVDITYTGNADYANVSITNISDANRIFKVKTLSNVKLTIDTQNQIVTNADGALEYEDYGLDNEDYIYWLRLLSGKNTLKVNCDQTGDILISIRCITPKKAGELYEY